MNGIFISKLFIAFIIYSFIGWAYESYIWAICEKKRFINRGFLIGPLTPIYGLVCILDYYLLRDLENPVAIFCTAMVVCCCAEYLISWSFEKLFHARWWDYSNYAFNLNGRISLYSGTLFGLGGLLLVKVVHPLVLSLLDKIPLHLLHTLSGLLAAGLIFDIIFTVVSMKNFNRKITAFYTIVNEQLDKPFEYLNDHKEEFENTVVAQKGSEILVSFEKFNEKMIEHQSNMKEELKEKHLVFKKAELHFIHAFPDFKYKFGKTELEHKKEILFSKIRDTINLYKNRNLEK